MYGEDETEEADKARRRKVEFEQMFFENFIEESKDLTSFDFKGRGNLAQTIRIVLNNKDISQVIKGTRRMTWRQEPKKDAISCEKPRGTASRF